MGSQKENTLFTFLQYNSAVNEINNRLLQIYQN